MAGCQRGIRLSTLATYDKIIITIRNKKQQNKCAITLRTMHELLGADSTMYIGHYLGLLQVGP